MLASNGRIHIDGGALTGLIDQFLSDPKNQKSCYLPNGLPPTTDAPLAEAEVAYIFKSPLETVRQAPSAQ